MLSAHHTLAALAAAVTSSGQLAEEREVNIGCFMTLCLKQNPNASQVMPSSSATSTNTAPAASRTALSDWLIDEDNAQATTGIHMSNNMMTCATQQEANDSHNTSSSTEQQTGDGQAHLQHVGYVVWQSGILLAELLLDHPPLGPWAPHIKLLDLGSGTGVTGIALARAGAAVTLTDRSHILPLTRENVAANCSPGCDVLVSEYCWGADASQLLQQMGGPPDIITAADVLYDYTQHGHLLDALRKCSAPHTIIYIAYRRRSSTEDRFVSAAEAVGYAVQAAPDSLLPEEYQGNTYCVLCLTSRDEGVAQASLIPASSSPMQGNCDEPGQSSMPATQGVSTGALLDEQPEHRPCSQQ